MARITKMLALAALAAALAGVAEAQPYRPGGGRGPSATLFEGPNFQGRQITVQAYGDNLKDTGFNDVAQSARFEGRWRVCDDSRYRGRCQDVSGDVADLNQVGMALKISSLQGYFEGVWNRGGWGGDRPFEGATGVLFPYPNLVGYDIAAGSASANAFCRSVGLGSSAYYDSNERARRALDGEGRYVGETDVLRDVFCRRR
ncbi:beta/gamma crystallin-related protein [Phenylobacterium sp.]|uniref:beta/gamma crystallin-related protein n=1 Tax=Phenylobacterium sp. TaxID=1871053 RepID=UPI002735C2D4|nr:beta/gamma crystallin-related protein [Phenylobacterium sp.]MDP3854353.1 beta/gamma crystallin-related protein [Phenylobacterium sp.]